MALSARITDGFEPSVPVSQSNREIWIQVDFAVNSDCRNWYRRIEEERIEEYAGEFHVAGKCGDVPDGCEAELRRARYGEHPEEDQEYLL